MTPLVLGEVEREALQNLRDVAANHPVNIVDLIERIKHPGHKALHRRQMTKQTVLIPFGFLITYSVETGHPCGTCRHMSISSPARGRMPSPEAVDMIAQELGFVGGFRACTCWIEDLERGEGPEKAINLVQPIAEVMSEVAHG